MKPPPGFYTFTGRDTGTQVEVTPEGKLIWGTPPASDEYDWNESAGYWERWMGDGWSLIHIDEPEEGEWIKVDMGTPSGWDYGTYN